MSSAVVWEPGAPLLGVNAVGLGVGEELFEYRDEARGRLDLRQMVDPVEDLESAAGDGLVGLLGVVDGNDRVTSLQMMTTGARPSARSLDGLQHGLIWGVR